MRKKLVAVLTMVVMVFCLAGVLPESLNPIEIVTAEASGMTIDQLKNKFPSGAYWNHAGSSSNNPDGYTNTPCTHHGNCSKGGTDYSGSCGCNSFDSSIQCMGFAHKLAYDAYGSSPRTWSTSSNLNNLKAGDVIRYKNNGHSIFVTAVNGDTITYADCNSDNHCKIMWDKTISKSVVSATLTRVYSAPSVLSTTHNPEGELYLCEGGAGTIHIEGYAFDRDAPNDALEINVYVDGNGYNVGNADSENEHVNNVIGIPGNHGFDKTFSVTETGTHHVDVYALNKGSGDNTVLGSANITIDPLMHSPEGSLDAYSGGNGTVYVGGWGFDPDLPDKSISVHVYLGTSDDAGICVGEITANTERSDVNTVHGCGNYHGFDGTISANVSSGTYFLRVALIDANGGAATWLDGGKVTIQNKTTSTVSPEGCLDAYSGGNGTVYVGGWGFDPDSLDESIGVHIYLGTNDSAGVCVGSITANLKRNDVNDAYDCGDYHGFDGTVSVNVAPGTYFLRVDLIDANGGPATWLDGGNVTIKDEIIPTISKVEISDISLTGYKVTVTALDNVEVKSVQLPTWTAKNRQDDIVWHTAAKTGQNTWTYTVKISDHNNEYGIYYTDIYVTDSSGNQTAWGESNGHRSTVKIGVYIVTFNANGGTCDTSNKNATYNSIYGTLPMPTRTGYNFNGWYTAKTGGTKITATSNYSITSNQILYAQWIANNYKVTFNVNGGTCGTSSVSVTYKSTYGTLPTPTREGFTFTGWYTAQTGGTKITDSTQVTITSDQILYAHWEKDVIEGDVNNDGYFNIADLVMMQKYLLHIGSLTAWENGDLYNDNGINGLDLALMRQKLFIL